MRTAANVLGSSALFASLAFSPPSHAWGDEGHRVVGEIASHYLTPRAAKAVQGCLTEVEYATLADASTWADVYARRVPGYGWAAPLHYVNVDAKAPRYVEARDCPGGCVVSAIRRFRAVLAEPGEDLAARKRRQEALYFLAHFVGDLHQPLHVAHPDARGGNSTEVAFFGEMRRAHWVWDEGIFARALQRIPAAGSVAPLQTWADVAFELRMTIAPAERATWQGQLDPEKWANESLALAKQHAYVKPGQVLDGAYVATTWKVVRRQLAKAGVRLAALLNEAFP